MRLWSRALRGTDEPVKSVNFPSGSSLRRPSKLGRAEILLIPGPVTVDDRVLAALGAPVDPHYGLDWARTYHRIATAAARIFKTDSEVVLLFGPGTAAMEMALGSVLRPGEEILIPTNGRFGERLVEIAHAVGFVVRTAAHPPLSPLDPDLVSEALDRYPRARAIAMVHHETGIGLINPIDDLCRIAREKGLLTVVDAVSSVGGMKLEVDGWGIDLCVGVANKCIGAPVGIAPVSVSARAWAAAQGLPREGRSWYLNLNTWRQAAEEMNDWHPHPTTMPTNAIHALGVAVELILEEGLDVYQGRHARAASRVRSGLRELGFEMLVPDEIASPVTTAVLAPTGMIVDDYLDWVRRAHRLRLAPGLGEWAGRIFRVGHMARASDPAVVEAFLDATREYLRTKVVSQPTSTTAQLRPRSRSDQLHPG
jgi:alanine-glyoxylate transaminase / serine-glyoxylate transaminase / serine-pyruvate transaminase